MAQQQGHTVQGVVLDSNQEPVIGANVLVKGTTVGTITDIDGRFTLEVSDNAEFGCFLYWLFINGIVPDQREI